MGGYVKIRSWHVRSGLVSRGGMVHTLCGRWASATALQSAVLPMGEKSCESCLRLKAQAGE